MWRLLVVLGDGWQHVVRERAGTYSELCFFTLTSAIWRGMPCTSLLSGFLNASHQGEPCPGCWKSSFSFRGSDSTKLEAGVCSYWVCRPRVITLPQGGISLSPDVGVKTEIGWCFECRSLGMHTLGMPSLVSGIRECFHHVWTCTPVVRKQPCALSGA